MSSYPGGKAGAGVYQQIICQIPPHRTYIEPFLGGGAVLRFKRPALRSVGVDLDAAALAAFDDAPDGAELVCADALTFLRSYAWQGDEFVYCDPPYLMEVRSTQRAIYQHEFATREEHVELLLLLRSLPCPVAISGYWSSLYGSLLATWRAISFQTVKRSGRPAQECLWMNYPAPMELHDYRYLGGNFRERERIKRKTQRWEARLRAMPPLERHAIFAAMQRVRGRPGGIAATGDADEM